MFGAMVAKQSAVRGQEPTHFLNVDLEIGARRGLDVLVEELTPHLFPMFRGKIGAFDRAHFEVGSVAGTIDGTMRSLVRALHKLSPTAKRAWRASNRRDFNIGIQAGLTPSSSEFEIAPKTAQDVAKLGGRIVITVYAPYSVRRPKSQRRKS
jgi:hypothetical protein